MRVLDETHRSCVSTSPLAAVGARRDVDSRSAAVNTALDVLVASNIVASNIVASNVGASNVSRMGDRGASR
jgi:hypothetical protein